MKQSGIQKLGIFAKFKSFIFYLGSMLLILDFGQNSPTVMDFGVKLAILNFAKVFLRFTVYEIPTIHV